MLARIKASAYRVTPNWTLRPQPKVETATPRGMAKPSQDGRTFWAQTTTTAGALIISALVRADMYMRFIET